MFTPAPFILPAGVAAYTANAVHFDGTNDYMTRDAALSGISDGKQGAYSLWVKSAGTDGTLMRLVSSTSSKFSLVRAASDRIQVVARNSAGTNLVSWFTDTADFVAGSWRHILISYDVSVPVLHIYVDDASNKQASGTLADGTIEYTIGNSAIGAFTSGVDKFTGDMADLWFSTTFIDISVESNRRKFISATGKPVDLGSDGSTPTGTAPVVFLSGATGSWHTNKGTGGGFTLTGTLDTASSSPST
jgi:hypothetical protein